MKKKNGVCVKETKTFWSKPQRKEYLLLFSAYTHTQTQTFHTFYDILQAIKYSN